MKILLLAPQPFYQERGTPIAIDLLVRELVSLNHTVHLLTFPEGEDKTYKGLTIYRLKKHFWGKDIRPGFSFKKLLLDIQMYGAACRMAKENKYDIIHSVEESAFIALLLKKKFKLPFVYDMDSSLSDQLIDKLSFLKFFEPLMQRFEKVLCKNALGVLAVCEVLAEKAKANGTGFVEVLRDCYLASEKACMEAENIKEKFKLKGKCIMYIGNLEPYQGIDLLLKSMAIVIAKYNQPAPSLVIVGGADKHIEHYRDMAKKMGTEKNVFFIGPRPVKQMNNLFNCADILVSPRIKGTNTPMKIYSYLFSGKPIVATQLKTHTQVLSEDIAVLTAPDENSFADGILKLLKDEAFSERLAASALNTAKMHHSIESFRKVLSNFYEKIAYLI
jgi:glycosyltransferase involved in cell wall biosynthesis